MKETVNDFQRPPPPWPIRAFNAMGPVLDRVGALPKLDVDGLMATARKKTGLDDYGDEWFREPLGRLVDSLNEEAQLSALGRTIMHTRLIGALSTRLRAEALFAAHPEIADVDLGHVIVIAGLQRTGTTTLHRLLSAEPKMRSMLGWEALNPAPLPGEPPQRTGEPGEPRARIRQGQIAERGLKYIAPHFFAIHPVEHDAPEEDVLLLDVSFMSQSAEATMHVPTYASWLESQDNTPAYEYLRKLMQLLSWQRPAENWVLKSPHHMEYIDTALRVFPEATIVQTHRDPRKTMASFASMVAHGRSVFSEVVSVKGVSEHWMRKVKRLMRLSMEVRDRLGDEHFIDVSYYDLLDDPVREVERIYAKAGIVFDETTRAAVSTTKKKNVQHRYGRHRYGLADFGLSPEQIEHEFGFYRERYGIPIE
jgi:hypothetical protein